MDHQDPDKNPPKEELVISWTGQNLKKIVPQLYKKPRDVTKLYLDNNEILKLEHLDRMPFIKELTMSYNQLARMYPIHHLKYLKKLDLSYNCIFIMEGLRMLYHLEYVNLAGNKIKAMERLQSNLMLEYIDLSENLFISVPNCSELNNLKTLHLHNNKITNLKSAELYLPKSLITLTLAVNKIQDLAEVSYLAHLPNLYELYFFQNPCVEMSYRFPVAFDFRPYLISWCLQLQIVDGYSIDALERDTAEWLYSQGTVRQFKPGQHEELADYLMDTCPFTTKERLSENECKLRLVLSKAHQHQRLLQMAEQPNCSCPSTSDESRPSSEANVSCSPPPAATKLESNPPSMPAASEDVLTPEQISAGIRRCLSDEKFLADVRRLAELTADLQVHLEILSLQNIARSNASDDKSDTCQGTSGRSSVIKQPSLSPSTSFKPSSTFSSEPPGARSYLSDCKFLDDLGRLAELITTLQIHLDKLQQEFTSRSHASGNKSDTCRGTGDRSSFIQQPFLSPSTKPPGARSCLSDDKFLANVRSLAKLISDLEIHLNTLSQEITSRSHASGNKSDTCQGTSGGSSVIKQPFSSPSTEPPGARSYLSDDKFLDDLGRLAELVTHLQIHLDKLPQEFTSSSHASGNKSDTCRGTGDRSSVIKQPFLSPSTEPPGARSYLSDDKFLANVRSLVKVISDLQINLHTLSQEFTSRSHASGNKSDTCEGTSGRSSAIKQPSLSPSTSFKASSTFSSDYPEIRRCLSDDKFMAKVRRLAELITDLQLHLEILSLQQIGRSNASDDKSDTCRGTSGRSSVIKQPSLSPSTSFKPSSTFSSEPPGQQKHLKVVKVLVDFLKELEKCEKAEIESTKIATTEQENISPKTAKEGARSYLSDNEFWAVLRRHVGLISNLELNLDALSEEFSSRSNASDNKSDTCQGTSDRSSVIKQPCSTFSPEPPGTQDSKFNEIMANLQKELDRFEQRGLEINTNVSPSLCDDEPRAGPSHGETIGTNVTETSVQKDIPPRAPFRGTPCSGDVQVITGTRKNYHQAILDKVSLLWKIDEGTLNSMENSSNVLYEMIERRNKGSGIVVSLKMRDEIRRILHQYIVDHVVILNQIDERVPDISEIFTSDVPPSTREEEALQRCSFEKRMFKWRKKRYIGVINTIDSLLELNNAQDDLVHESKLIDSFDSDIGAKIYQSYRKVPFDVRRTLYEEMNSLMKLLLELDENKDSTWEAYRDVVSELIASDTQGLAEEEQNLGTKEKKV